MALKFRDFFKPKGKPRTEPEQKPKPMPAVSVIAKPAVKKTPVGKKPVPTLVDTEERNYAVFMVGDEWYGIDLNAIVEILHAFEVIPVPHLPPAFAGVTNLRGESLPVVDLARLLKVASTSSEIRSCIIVQIGSAKIGFMSDSDVEIINQSLGHRYPLPGSFSREESTFLEGIFWYKDAFIGIFKPEPALEVLSEWRIDHEEK